MDQNPDLTLAGLAHDLNNVFQTLVEAAYLLSDDAKWESLSALIVRSVERGKELTLHLQKADQPSGPLEKILDYARSFVQDSLVGGRGPEIHFVFEIEPSLELPHLRSWERVLVNLFSNAVTAMPGGGTIFVRARRIGALIEMVVADDGPGIDAQLLPSVFKPHVSSRVDGGLGLHIVESLVRQENGQVRAANRVNGGAEFTIVVPSEPAFLRRANA